jgi:hypothetical protein
MTRASVKVFMATVMPVFTERLRTTAISSPQTSYFSYGHEHLLCLSLTVHMCLIVYLIYVILHLLDLFLGHCESGQTYTSYKYTYFQNVFFAILPPLLAPMCISFRYKFIVDGTHRHNYNTEVCKVQLVL